MKNSVILIAVLFSTILVACNVTDDESADNLQTLTFSQSETPVTEVPLTEEEKILLKKYTFLTSFEGNQYQGTAYQFCRAYFLADIETAKSLMACPDDNNLLSNLPPMNMTLDDIDWLVLKVGEYIPSGENIGKVFAQYEVRIKPNDSFVYLGIDMDNINGKWKVTNFYLEK